MMIFFNLVKKEVLHFFRNKANVGTMFIFPVVLIVIMGFSLNGLMNVDQNIFENKKVYFKVNNVDGTSNYFNGFMNFKDSCTKDMKIDFIEISDDNYGKSNVNTYEALAFITIDKDNYYFYRNDKKESKAQKIFRSVFDQYLDTYAVVNTVAKENPQVLNNAQVDSNTSVIEEGIFSEGITSFTYYTFAVLVLIILYISQITSVASYKETLQNTFSRLKVSKASDLSVILSKISLGLIVGIIQISVVYFVSNVFLKINWGGNIKEIIAVLLALVFFSSVLGITISYIFKDSKAAASVINTLLIILGFLGGSYLPISLVKSNAIANFLCNLTPTYWANISLLSLSSGISTNYSNIAILLSLQLSGILLIICIISSLKAGDRHV